MRFLPKTLLFAFCGAFGCVVAALVGELLWLLTPVSAAPPAPQVKPSVDVLFLLDITGSMQKGINGLKTGIEKFSDELLSKGIDARVGLIAFGDRLFGEEPIILSFDGSPFTTDTAKFRSAVAGLRLVNGGDPPESSMDAMTLGCDQPFRPGAKKAIVLITDAPPHIPDKSTSSIAEVTKALRRHEIDQLHLVATITDRPIYEKMRVEAAAKGGSLEGEFFNIASEADFGRLVPNVGASIARTTLAQQGLVARQTGSDRVRPYQTETTAAWTALLALGITLALIAGQNSYLRRRLLSKKEIIVGGVGSILTGIVAGVVAEELFALVTRGLGAGTAPALLVAARLFGWTVLGAFLGGGMSFFVPNLKFRRGMLGGAIGGFLGAIGFQQFTGRAGEITGRLAGAAILGFCIGLMLAIIERIYRAREAGLIVNWGSEKAEITLGATPVVLGSTSEAHVYLPASQGFPAVAATVALIDGHVVMENRMTNSRHVLANGNKLKIGPVVIEVHTAA